MEGSVEIGDYLAVLRRRKSLIVCFGALFAGLALVYSYGMVKAVYASSAQVQVRPIAADSTSVRIDQVISMSTERELAGSDTVAVLVKERLKSPLSPSELSGKADVTVLGTTQILQIRFSDGDPIRAQQGAQAFAEAYLQYRADTAGKDLAGGRELIENELAGLEERIEGINGEIASSPVGSPDRASALNQLDQLTSQAAKLRAKLVDNTTFDINPGSVVGGARLPKAPFEPKPARNGVLGLLFGLIAGTVAAFMRDRLDSSLRGRSDLEDHLRAPVLTTLPKGRASGAKADVLVTLSNPNSPTSEAFRTLRTRLLVLADQTDLKTVMVVSPTAHEPKAAVAANLAVSLSQVGKRVVLLSADLRRPRVHQYFGIENNLGLSDVLLGSIPPWEAAHEPAGIDRLWVFPSGSSVSQPGELLQSDLMRELIAERRQVADFVVIDAAPVLTTSDALALAPLVDGIIFVADARTSRESVARVREQLEQVGGRVVGAVLTGSGVASS